MNPETLLFTWVVVVALFPVAEIARRHRPKKAGLIFAGWFLTAALAGWFSHDVAGNRQVNLTADHMPVQTHMDGYVSSDNCRSCHPREYSTWHTSYHRSMTQLATPTSVTGRFDGQTEMIQGKRYVLERVGDEFFAEFDRPTKHAVEGVEQPRIRRKIELTTGSHHMQVYWYSTGHTRRLGMLPIVYVHEIKRWVPRNSAFLQPPNSISDETGRWNTVCVDCHTTNGKSLTAGDFDFDTQVSEFGIACESCHGPAEEHIEIHRDPILRYASRSDEVTDPSITDPAKLTAHRSSEVCGLCHSISWSHSPQHHHAYRPGDRLADYWKLTELNAEERSETEAVQLSAAFWPDGMIRIAGREYNGLMNSPCYTHDRESEQMSCLSCHQSHQATDDPRPPKEWADHQLAVDARGNQACTQCHDQYTDQDRLQAHTHHAADSTGSLCYNCHMPYSSYGLLQAVRSHTVDSPDALTGQQTGRLTACNQCHIDRSLGWTATQLKDWYGHPTPRLLPEEERTSATILHALKGDAGQRAIVAWSLGWDAAHQASGTDWIAPYLAELINDPYDAVRYIATRSIKSLPGYSEFKHDYISSATELSEGRARALGRWQPANVAKKSRRRELLLDTDGYLMSSLFDQIRARRDDRPMKISE